MVFNNSAPNPYPFVVSQYFQIVLTEGIRAIYKGYVHNSSFCLHSISFMLLDHDFSDRLLKLTMSSLVTCLIFSTGSKLVLLIYVHHMNVLKINSVTVNEGPTNLHSVDGNLCSLVLIV